MAVSLPEEWNLSLPRPKNNDAFLCNDGHDRADLNEKIYFHHRRQRMMTIIQTTPRTELNIVAGVSSSLLHCVSLLFCRLSTGCCPTLYAMFENKLIVTSNALVQWWKWPRLTGGSIPGWGGWGPVEGGTKLRM